MTQIKEESSDRRKSKAPAKEKYRKTLTAAAALLIPFAGCMYLIFGGGKADSQTQGQINVSVPDGRSSGIEASKQRAVQQVAYEDKQQQRSALCAQDAFSLMQRPDKDAGQPLEEDPAAQSRKANAEAAKAVSGFYTPVRRDPEIALLKNQVKELNEKLEQQPLSPDPLELAEKQYALAAKYLAPTAQQTAAETSAAAAQNSRRKGPVRRVRSIGGGVVSTLSRPAAENEPQGERNRNFNTAVGDPAAAQSAGIRACIDEDQTLCNGDRVRLRLTEAIEAGNSVLNPGSVLFGTAAISSQRLRITVTGIEYGGDVIPVELKAYDMDGGEGLYIPDSQERTAVKEAAAGMGESLNSGTSISFGSNAGQQIAMDLTRGLLAGGSKYIASKVRQVKITVKAGYQILLIPQN